MQYRYDTKVLFHQNMTVERFFFDVFQDNYVLFIDVNSHNSRYSSISVGSKFGIFGRYMPSWPGLDIWFGRV